MYFCHKCVRVTGPSSLNQIFNKTTHALTRWRYKMLYSLNRFKGFPRGSVVKNPPANAGDTGLILRSGRSPREGNDNPLQYSCLGNPMDRGTWQAIVHGVERVRHNLATKQQQIERRGGRKEGTKKKKTGREKRKKWNQSVPSSQ